MASGRDTIIERKVIAAGDIIFKQGSTGHTAYIVQKGTVEIVRKNDDGPEQILATIGAGAMFGEMSLIDDSPRMATARARDAATVIVITEQMFLAKMKKADPFIRGLLNIMADTIRSMSRKAGS